MEKRIRITEDEMQALLCHYDELVAMRNKAKSMKGQGRFKAALVVIANLRSRWNGLLP